MNCETAKEHENKKLKVVPEKVSTPDKRLKKNFNFDDK